MSEPGVVAVLGTRSFAGQGLLARLRERAPRIRLVAIDARRPEGRDDRVRFARVDLTEPAADARLAEVFEKERVEVVAHTAFRGDPTPDREADHELEAIGSVQVMNACAAAKVRRLVVTSSTMLYGARPDNPNYLDESRPLRGHPDAHHVCDRIEMEESLAAWRDRHPDVETTVLRSCWLMGPTFWDRVTAYFSLPVVPVPLGYDPLLQLVHEDDWLHALATAVVNPHPGVFNVVGAEPLPVSTLLRLAGKRALPLPARLLHPLAYYPSQGQTGDPPAAFYDFLRYLWVADGRRGWEAFGEPHYTTKEAWVSFVTSRRSGRIR